MAEFTQAQQAEINALIELAMDNRVQLRTDGGAACVPIKAINKGPGTAINVEVAVTIPTGASYISANPDQGSYSDITHVWSVGTLTSGQEQTLAYCIQIDDSSKIPMDINYTISSSTTDPVAGNNALSVTIDGISCADIKSCVGGAALVDNSDGTYTFTDIEGVDVTFNGGWTTVAKVDDTMTFTYPDASTVVVTDVTSTLTAEVGGEYTYTDEAGNEQDIKFSFDASHITSDGFLDIVNSEATIVSQIDFFQLAHYWSMLAPVGLIEDLAVGSKASTVQFSDDVSTEATACDESGATTYVLTGGTGSPTNITVDTFNTNGSFDATPTAAGAFSFSVDMKCDTRIVGRITVSGTAT